MFMVNNFVVWLKYSKIAMFETPLNRLLYQGEHSIREYTSLEGITGK